LGLVGTWFVAGVTRVHMVQESILIESEVEVMALKNYMSHLLLPIATKSILFVCAKFIAFTIAH
jgi:hypothetical protein